MAVGQGALFSGLSYVGIGREQTFGTAVTATAGINFISSSIKAMKESQVLEQIETNRTYSKSIGLGRVIEGDLEFFLSPDNTAGIYLLENVFGTAVTSATATGETTGGSAFDHTFQVGNIDTQTYTSLTVNIRKGDATNGKVMEYTGMRINEMVFSSEIDNALMATASFMGKDATTGGADVSGNFGLVQQIPLNFDAGRLSIESSFASLTSTSFWHIQSFEFGINNSLKSESEARRIGSDTVDVMPPGIASFTFTTTIRFDTTTAYDAMIAGSEFAAELEFFGPNTISGSNLRPRFNLTMPRILISEAGEPEIGGPDEIITSEVTFLVLRDDSSASGYAVQGIVTNDTSSYA